jgi:polar amino acid transport system substrate-binding protein
LQAGLAPEASNRAPNSESVVSAAGGTIVRFPTIVEAVRALRRGEIDAVVGQDEMLFAAEKDHPELMMADWRPFAVERCHLAVRKGEAEWFSFLSEGLKRIESTTEYYAILEKWFGLPRALLYERMLSS